MDNVKNIIKENKLMIIALILVIIAIVTVGVLNNKKENQVKEGRNPEKIDQVEYVKVNHKVNEYQNMVIDDLDVLEEYYEEFITLLCEKPKEAYLKLSVSSKNKYTEEEFLKYVKSIKTVNTKNNKLTSYRKSRDSDRTYDIKDSEGNHFVLYEKAVWDYQITLD